MLGVIDPELGDNVVDLGMYRDGRRRRPTATWSSSPGPDDRGLPAAGPAQARHEGPGRQPARGDHGEGQDDRGEPRRREGLPLMARARWKAQGQGAHHRQPAGDDPGDRHLLGQGRRGQVVGDGQPGRRSGRTGASRSGCSTPTSPASPSPACSAWRARSAGEHGERGRRNSARSMRPMAKRVRRRPAQGACRWVPRRPRTRPSCGAGSCSTGPCSTSSRTSSGATSTTCCRHAARDRRHPDGTGPHAAARRDDHRHHARSGRPEGGRASRRHGPQGVSAGGRGDREHERLRLRPRRALRPVRVGRRRGLAAEIGAPLLGQIPLEAAVSAGGDCRRAGRARHRSRGRGVPGHRRRHRSKRPPRRSPWPAARPACSTPPWPPSTNSTPSRPPGLAGRPASLPSASGSHPSSCSAAGSAASSR